MVQISVSLAQKKDEVELKRLFLNSFDDTLGFVNMFFLHHFVPENTAVAYCGEKIVGQAHMLPCIALGKPCFYVYGVCVNAEHRGQGIGLRMLEFVKTEAQRRGGAVLLHPAETSLFHFYEKAGMKPCGAWCICDLPADAAPCELRAVTPQEYKEIRDKAFAEKNGLVWDLPSVEYALMQETFYGLSYYKICTQNRTDIVLCGQSGGEPYIKETTARGEQLLAVAAAVAKKLGGESVKARLPGDAALGERQICGYGTGLEKDVYMNLLLD